MNEYIIYTAEGLTYPPREDKEVENCQVLGRACGTSEIEARDNLIKQSPWILECGFDIQDTICKQLVTDDLRVMLKKSSKKIDFLESLLDKRQIDEYKKWLSYQL
ncbi:MAG: hypothetical protein U0I09_04300 [Bacteroidaceae bacterium]|nr:hypothetical protein [Bacteroidaceae bacterium]